MTLTELFRLVEDADPENREELASELIKQLNEDEKSFAEGWVGEFIASIQPLEIYDGR